VKECEEKVHAELESAFDDCEKIDDDIEYDECLDEVNSVLEEMLAECYY
jgi:hypothetical protein